MSILSKIEMIVRDELDDDDIVLTPETRARDVDGWDSLAHIRLMVAVERAFSVRFTTAAITELENVGALISLIERYKK